MGSALQPQESWFIARIEGIKETRMRSTSNAVFLTAALSWPSQASVVTFETAPSSAGPQADAAAYRTVVEDALTLPGARSTVLSLFDNASNHAAFGGSTTNVAYRFTVEFEVTPAAASNWGIRIGVDFGRGGAVFLDGASLAHNSGDMWWAGSYADTSQSFQFPSLPLTAGIHTLQVYGLEDCCDGGSIGQQAQFSIAAGPYKTFGIGDGLLPVPEPQRYALMLAGVAVLAYMLRHGRSRSIRGALGQKSG
jgi:hypothetical protein